MFLKTKNNLSLFLIGIFLIPLLSKGLDVIFHQHDNFVCVAKNEKHLHKLHDTCSIASFTFSSFLVKTPISFFTKTPIHTYKQSYFYFSVILKTRKTSFSLRAPPIL